MMSASTVGIVRKLPNIVLVLPLWFLTLIAFREVFDDSDDPKWGYLWDDKINYLDNTHLTLNNENIIWAFKEGIVAQVYEPVALVIKQILHYYIEFNARTYRVVNLVCHLVNVYLCLVVSRVFLTSVNHYSLNEEEKLKDEILKTRKRQEKMELSVINQRNPRENETNPSSSTNGALRNRKKKSTNTRNQSALVEHKMHLQNQEDILESIQRQDAMGTIGCVLGTGIFAVHPLQAHTIGWASCMSYFFAGFFTLLSFWAFFIHKRKLQMEDKPREEASLIRITPHKGLALFFYVLATFCKAPAITLPAVFVIVHVFVYSSPMSLSKDMQLKRGLLGYPSYLLPHRIIIDFCKTFPKLWKLTLVALQDTAIFFTPVLIMVFLLERGNADQLVKVSELTGMEKIHKAVWALMWYIYKVFVPTNLVASVVIHSYNVSDHWEVGASLILVPYGTLAILSNSVSSTPNRILACCWGTFVAILFPSLGFIHHGRNFFVADRYMYIPLLMLGPIVGSLASAWSTINSETNTLDTSDIAQAAEVASKKKKARSKVRSGLVGAKDYQPLVSVIASAILATIFGSLLIFSSAVAPRALHHWRNTELLWSHNARIYPDNPSAHTNLVSVYSSGDKEDLDKALFHSKSAVNIVPNVPHYWFNLVMTYWKRGDHEENEAFLKKYIQYLPDSHYYAVWLHYYYGKVLVEIGEWGEAEVELKKAASLKNQDAQNELDALIKKKANPNAEMKAKQAWLARKKQKAPK